MEIKAILEKPYTEFEKFDFIAEYNHQMGYEIKETDTALEAWGETESELLEGLKKAKYNEATSKAKSFIDSGKALFEFQEGKHIEATDGNIGKLTAYALAYVTGALQPTDTVPWSTKEDIKIELTQNDISTILSGLGAIQANIWTNKFEYYVNLIENATTVDEVKAIEIDYSKEEK